MIELLYNSLPSHFIIYMGMTSGQISLQNLYTTYMRTQRKLKMSFTSLLDASLKRTTNSPMKVIIIQYKLKIPCWQ